MDSDTGPFALIPEWVLDAGIGPRAIQLYAVLGRYADTAGKCWPSRRTLWTRMGCSERTLDGAVKELLGIGALVRVYRPRADDKPGMQTNDWQVIRTANPAPPGADSAGTPGAETDAENESYLEREPSLATAAPPRKRDDIFDALVGLTGIDPSELTKPGRGALNGAVRELRLLNASGPDVIARAHAYSRKYPNAVLTAPALVKHWAELGNGHRPSNGKSLSLEESKATFAQLMESP